jgi:hypothetical protein
MNKILYPSFQNELYSEKTEHNYLSNIKNISYKNSSESSSSLNKTSNQTYLKVSLYPTGVKEQKNGASFCLNLIKNQNRQKIDNINNYTQRIILHTVKNKKTIDDEESKIQKIILKSLKKEKTEIKRETKKDEINFLNKLEENINKNTQSYSINKNNIIRVIISSEKIIKNFPMEYLNEMMIDICHNLLNDECTYEKIKINSQNLGQNFFELRKYYFNFILQISTGSPLSESTIFLSYAIFDRYLCSTRVNYDEYLLIIITSFILAIKYNESSEANFDELCELCGRKFNKEDIKRCEINIMEKLNFNLSLPTIFDLFQFIKIIKYLSEKEYFFGLFVLEMYLINGGNLKYNALIIIEAVYNLINETEGKQTKKFILYDYLFNIGINFIQYDQNINNCLSDIKHDCANIKKNSDFSCLINKFSDEQYQKISIDFQLI